MSKKSSKR